jgi:DNA (cytosine-5)-methyltransferase 1
MILNAADYGAYTSRKRFFGIFAKQGLPIVFPAPTHAKTVTGTEQPTLFEQKHLKKWKPVKEVLDFSDEGESIFTRKKPLSDKTLERIYAGLIKFIAGGKDNFLSAYYGSGKNFEGRINRTAKSTDEPCGVLTTENRFAKVQCNRMLKYNSVNGKTGKHVPPSVDEPCPVVSVQGRLGIVSAKFLSKQYSGHPESKNISVENPAHTVTPIDHHALISASFIQQRNSGNPSHKVVSVESPARTITATGGNQELVQAKFIGVYSNAKGKQATNALSLENPCPTITVFDRLSLISPHFIVNEYSGGGQHSSIDEVCPAVLTRPKQKVVSCSPRPISTEAGQIAIEVYETDSEPMRKIKEFMALYGIIDIKMRMLKIPELKRIMGFPEDYTLIGTQAEQKKYIGNAVEVNMARVLCEELVKIFENSNNR